MSSAAQRASPIHVGSMSDVLRTCTAQRPSCRPHAHPFSSEAQYVWSGPLLYCRSLDFVEIYSVQVAAGFLATNALVPLCAAYTVLRPDITWSGTRYWKRNGRIMRVRREAP